MTTTRRALLGLVAGLPLALKALASERVEPRSERESCRPIWVECDEDGSPDVTFDLAAWEKVLESTGFRRIEASVRQEEKP